MWNGGLISVNDLPAAVRAKARDAGVGAWVDGLPALLGEITRAWGLTLGAVHGDATEACVVDAFLADRTPVVLKLVVPGRGGVAAYEIMVLGLAAGVGCARLLESDAARGALLLERLGPAMSELGLPQPRRLEILCDLAAAVWRRTDLPLPTGAEKAARLASGLRPKWSELGEPCAAATVEQAVAAAESRRRAHDPARAVLVHGDVHQWNALRSGDGFKLIDPDGLVAEPECDLGVLMREDPVELIAADPWDRAHLLAARTGTDPVAIWEWGVADRVATGLTLIAVGLHEVGTDMLRAADRIAHNG